MSEYIHQSHNVTVLMYHIVLPAKYRCVIFDDEVNEVLKDVHIFVQSLPRYSVTKVVTMIKSISAREVFRRCPKVKKLLWGGEIWTDRYYAETVGKYGNKDSIRKYVKGQGGTYQKRYSDYQLSLF